MEDLLNRFKSTMEQILTEMGMSEGSVEVDTLKEQVYIYISMDLDVWVAEKRVCLARSQAVWRCQ